MRLAAVSSELKKRLPVSFSIIDLFRNPTVRSFVDALQVESGGESGLQSARERAARGRRQAAALKSRDRQSA